MFEDLLESRARTVGNRGGTVVSVIGHALFIAAAVAATRTPLAATRLPERVVPLPVLVPVAAPMEQARSAAARPSGPTVVAPSPPVMSLVPVIPLPGMPPVDLSLPPATALGWEADGAPFTGGISTGPTSSAGDSGIPFAPGVEKPALALPGNPLPRYPEILRGANVKGEVVVRVVIDTTGRADMATLRVISSDHALMTEAVIAVLPRAHFLPAETGGRKVPMWAVQSFVFELR